MVRTGWDDEALLHTLGSASIASLPLRLRAILGNVALFTSFTSALEGSGLRATYSPTAVIALAALHTVPGEVPNTTAGVTSLASAAEAPVATATTTVSASAAAATATATAAARRLWAAARDMARLTTAVTLGTRIATRIAPATASGGAVARLVE